MGAWLLLKGFSNVYLMRLDKKAEKHQHFHLRKNIRGMHPGKLKCINIGEGVDRIYLYEQNNKGIKTGKIIAQHTKRDVPRVQKIMIFWFT